MTRTSFPAETSVIFAGETPDRPALALQSILGQRRSIRRLRSGPFTAEMRERLLEAVRLTPAAYNLPPWRVVLVHERREAFWAEVERGFRETLDGEQLERYLERLRGFAPGVAVALVFADTGVERELREKGAAAEVAASFVQQGLGMAQFSLWLAVTAEGMATSLQHWDHLIGPRLARFAELDDARFALAATMPIGFADEEPRPIERVATALLCSADGRK